MALIHLKGSIESYIDHGHVGGYIRMSALQFTGQDGKRTAISGTVIVRSDIGMAMDRAMTGGDEIELYIEKSQGAWDGAGRQVFGLKQPHMVLFDSTPVALITHAIPPAAWIAFGLLLFMVSEGVGIVAYLVLSLISLAVLWVPLLIVLSAIILCTGVDRRGIFYGDDPTEAERLKALMPANV
jgi:hypothetical protein